MINYLAKEESLTSTSPVVQRINELLNGQEGEYSTLVQIAMRGTKILLSAPEITSIYSEDVIKQIISFIQEVLLYTPELNGDRTPALIEDKELNELLTQNGGEANLTGTRLIDKVPSNISQYIYLYVRYLGYSSEKPSHLGVFKNQLFEVIQTTHISDYEVSSCLHTLQEIINTFHRINGI